MQSTVRRSSETQPNVSDQVLVKQALAGDQSSYEALTRRYQDRLFRGVLLEVNCRSVAEEIVQDAFVRAFLNLKSFRNQCSFYTWLYQIALHERYGYHRKCKKTLSIDTRREYADIMLERSEDLPPRSIERIEECGQVRAALQRLDEPHRTILILREFEGFDYQTIAGLLGIKIGTVRSRLSRARDQLRTKLAAYLQAGELTDTACIGKPPRH